MKKTLMTMLTIATTLTAAMPFSAYAATAKLPAPEIREPINGYSCVVYAGDDTSKGTIIYTGDEAIYGKRPTNSMIKTFIDRGYEVVLYEKIE